VAYLALARKYRPQRFADMIGQEHVTRTLENAIKTDRVHHAYLFCGVRGLGKTTAARILAKCLVCEQGPTPEPCNACHQCVAVNEGRSVDVVEIDGASNNSVDDIRSLRDQVNYLPHSARRKIYIIDEVHMLTQQAFNALLKTLEEPPPHVTFMFATTDPHKVLPTILSRVSRLDYRRVRAATLVPYLAEILTHEGFAVADEGLQVIARCGEGSVRDSLTLLDKVLAFAHEPSAVTADEVLTVLGQASRYTVALLVQAILDRDVASVLARFEDVTASGSDLMQLAMAILQHLRDLTVVKLTGSRDALLDMDDDLYAQIVAQAEGVSAELVAQHFDRFARTVDNLDNSRVPRLVIEMGLLELANAEPLLPLGDLVARLDALAGGRRGVGGAGSGPAGGRGGGGRPREGHGSRPPGSTPGLTGPRRALDSNHAVEPGPVARLHASVPARDHAGTPDAPAPMPSRTGDTRPAHDDGPRDHGPRDAGVHGPDPGTRTPTPAPASVHSAPPSRPPVSEFPPSSRAAGSAGDPPVSPRPASASPVPRRSEQDDHIDRMEQLARDAGLLPGSPAKPAGPSARAAKPASPRETSTPTTAPSSPVQALALASPGDPGFGDPGFELTNEDLDPVQPPGDPEAGCPSSRCVPREAIPWRTMARWDAWETFLERIRDEHDMLAPMLGDVGLVELRAGMIALASPANSFARSQLRENPELRTAFEHLTAVYFGEVMHLELVDVAASLPDAPSLTLVEEQRALEHREAVVADARHNPRIRSLLHTFGGQLETIEPLGAPALPPVGQRGLPMAPRGSA
jgi:DNA polymerase III subunit gamma/tau